VGFRLTTIQTHLCWLVSVSIITTLVMLAMSPAAVTAQDATPSTPDTILPVEGVNESSEVPGDETFTDVGTAPNTESVEPEAPDASSLDGTGSEIGSPGTAAIEPREDETGATDPVPDTSKAPVSGNSESAQVPATLVNTDAIAMADGVTEWILAPGVRQSLSLHYDVTTPRAATTIHARLVDEAGNSPAGWLLGSGDSDDIQITDTMALLPGSSFNALLSVTAPDTSEALPSVSLLVWSETTSDRGPEPGIDRQVLATFMVAVAEEPASSPAAPMVAEPELTVAPLDFGVLTWNGESWGSTQAATTVTIARSGDTGPVGYDIQVEMIGDVPGFRPMLTGVSTSDDNITLLATSGDPNTGPLSVAHVAADFTGTTDLLLTFTSTPTNDAPPGTQHLEMKVTSMPAP